MNAPGVTLPKVAKGSRQGADKASLMICQKVVQCVTDNDECGDDSALYEAMGYVRKPAQIRPREKRFPSLKSTT